MEYLDFLHQSPDPWVVYRALLDLDGRKASDPEVLAAKRDMMAHPLIRDLIGEMKQWPGVVLNSHKSAGQLYHKLAFLADLGITGADADFSAVERVMRRHVSDEGLYRLPTHVPVHFGGTGTEEWGWALCDAPLQLYAAAKMRLIPAVDLKEGVTCLLGVARDNGWPCKVSKELGKFRGPGRKGDPCPYATLIMLKLLRLFPEFCDGQEVRAGIECLLSLWENSRAAHPYMFFMGTDFRKLKVPYIWYDLLHVADVLSTYDLAVSDDRFHGMLAVINDKADQHGLYTAESIWTAWKAWEFAQKSRPSAWLTLMVYRIGHRAGKVAGNI